MMNENNDSLDLNKEGKRGEQIPAKTPADVPGSDAHFPGQPGTHIVGGGAKTDMGRDAHWNAQQGIHTAGDGSSQGGIGGDAHWAVSSNKKPAKKGSDQENKSDLSEHKASKPHLFLFLGIIAVVIVIIFFAGLIPKIGQSVDLNKEHQETVDAVPNVHVIVAKPAARTESITLPGNIGAMQYATIYARVDGYLKTRFVDIGDEVKAGQLLAEIETPTVDQAVLQAAAALGEARAKLKNEQANLKQAQEKKKAADAEVEKSFADVEYARITATRWENLVERGAVSQQSRDEKVRTLESTASGLEAQKANQKAAVAAVVAAQSTVVMAQAAIDAKLADYNKERAQQSFQKVTAPFDGIITLRKVDPGALITAGSSSSTLELFQLAKVDVLRIYVAVPQRIARFLKAGMDADIMPSEFPDRKFVGKVTNVSGALDSNTRTRQTEIHVKNPDHALLPGMYAEIKLTTLREAPWIRVPGTTLVVRPSGQFVATVENEKVHYQKITIGRDYGDEVEVKTGLKGNEQVVISPSDDLLEGQKVKTIQDKKDDGV